jgi:hypothetical protein
MVGIPEEIPIKKKPVMKKRTSLSKKKKIED